MFIGRTTLTLIFFAPLGLSLTCTNRTNTAEWSVSVICRDPLENPSEKCNWDAVDAKTGQRVEKSHFTLAAPVQYFHCSEKFRLQLSPGEYVYYIYFKNTWAIAYNLQIDDPGLPTVNNCENEVLEGGSVTCVCSTELKGNPPPAISWKGQTSPTLLLQNVRHEQSKTYTCEMIWGNQTKTIFYRLVVRTGQDEVENEDKNNISSMPVGIIGAAAAAVFVIITTAVIVIVIIRRKRLLSKSPRSNSRLSKDGLNNIRNYGSEESMMACENYAEVTDSGRHEDKSTEPVVYANAGTNEERQIIQPALYGNVETNEGRETTQVDLYAVVEKTRKRQPVQPELYALVDEEDLKRDNCRFQCEKEIPSEGDVYAVVKKGANTGSRVLSAPVEEMYAQVVKSPK